MTGGPFATSHGSHLDAFSPKSSVPSVHGSVFNAAQALKVYSHGRGGGGLEELRAAATESTVQWALHRIEIGSGVFKRTKLVAFVIHGGETPVVKKGRALSHSNEVVQMLGYVHATVEVESVAELTLDLLVEKAFSNFVADVAEGGDEEDHGQLRRRYVEACHAHRLQRQKTMMMMKSGTNNGKRVSTKKFQQILSASKRRSSSASEVNWCLKEKKISKEVALGSVASSSGPYNWILLDPVSQELVDAGNGGVDEMSCFVDHRRFFCGLLRLSFGGTEKEPDAKFTRHVFVQWEGHDVHEQNLARGRSQVQQCRAQVCRVCDTVAFGIVAKSKEDLHIERLVSDLKQNFGEEASLGDVSVDGYLMSLAQEQLATVEEKERLQSGFETAEHDWSSDDSDGSSEESFADCVSMSDEGINFDPVEAVREVRNGAGIWNWVLLSLDHAPGCGEMHLPYVTQHSASLPQVSTRKLNQSAFEMKSTNLVGSLPRNTHLNVSHAPKAPELLCGHLEKLHGSVWERFFFQIQNHHIVWWRCQEDATAHAASEVHCSCMGCINLLPATIVVQENSRNKAGFTVDVSWGGRFSTDSARHRIFSFDSSRSEHSRALWVDAISTHAVYAVQARESNAQAPGEHQET